jgi:hypothetical protein
MDLGTGLTLLGSAKLAEKLLGPTLEYVGENFKVGTQKAAVNLNNILKNAVKKLGPKLDEPGGVPPKALKTVLADGAFCEDSIGTEYFGGVLASARTENSRDDRAVTYLSLIGRLSTYQLRTHYLLYQTLKMTLKDKSSNQRINQSVLELYIPESVYDEAMDFLESENKEIIVDHSIVGLSKEGLISDCVYGDVDTMQAHSRTPIGPFQLSYRYNLERVTEGGIVFQPTALGFELFFWAHGKPDFQFHDFLNPEIDFPIIEGLSIKPGAILM